MGCKDNNTVVDGVLFGESKGYPIWARSEHAIVEIVATSAKQ